MRLFAEAAAALVAGLTNKYLVVVRAAHLRSPGGKWDPLTSERTANARNRCPDPVGAGNAVVQYVADAGTMLQVPVSERAHVHPALIVFMFSRA